MKSAKALLWDRLTSDLGEWDFYTESETPRAKEHEKIYAEMCEKFSDMLTDVQKEAFYHLRDIGYSVECGWQEAGIAIGVCIAKELYGLVASPMQAFQAASESWLPARESERINIAEINKAFEVYVDENGERGKDGVVA